MVVPTQGSRLVFLLGALASYAGAQNPTCNQVGADGVCSVSYETDVLDNTTNATVSQLTGITDAWMDALGNSKSPKAAAALFCDEAVFITIARDGLVYKTYSEDGWGTKEANGVTMESYFDWFTKLPDKTITSYHDNVKKIDDNVWVNNVWVNWTWAGTSAITARKTFILKKESSGQGFCIIELHSSQLPSRLEDVKDSTEDSQLGNHADITKDLVGREWQEQVEKLTSQWMVAVVKESDPEKVASLFCDDGMLLPTAAMGLRLHRDSQDGFGAPSPADFTIRSYFDWFAKLPGQDIARFRNNVMKISERVFVNNAWVHWVWEGNPGLTARMTFIIRSTERGPCIFELHSSRLPEGL
eukprot:TRINITY_DN384_c0_g2_i1.p1 TRINITY_DN384_c0_g2~~TRINITY_DN384_c0_g2_i1.p1  ORF type:complete len:357 (-),score=73.32 TRINITY_DN384_c0_g2_i1:199-1269(-)